MAQRVWRSDDTDKWKHGFGKGSAGNGVISANETQSIPNHTFTGTIATKAGVVDDTADLNVGDIVVIHQSRGTGAGHIEYNVIASIVNSTDLTFKYDLTLTYASQSQLIAPLQYKTLTVNSGVTVTAPAYSSGKGGFIVYWAKESIDINGALNLKSKGYAGGAKSSWGNWASQGEGTAGAGSAAQAANGNGGGGGKSGTGNAGSHPGGGGGGGGHANAGSNGANASYTGDGGGLLGYGGSAVGSATMIDVHFGGGGAGSGSAFSQCSGNYWANGQDGSKGGGIVILIAPTININNATGSINLGSDNTSNSDGNAGTSGSGAGGSGLFKGIDVNLGTTRVTASAGTTGTSPGRCSSTGGRGGQGSVGRLHVDYSGSISGTTTPTLDSRLDATIIPVSKKGGLLYSLA